MLWINDEKKLIVKMHCSCWNFANRRIKKHGSVHNIKFYAEPCKHLESAVDSLKNQGYSIKIPSNKGSDKLTTKIKRGVIKVWGNTCFYNNCERKDITIHRLVRGNAGGKYSLLNCRPLCPVHHKMMHQKEF